jgi:uncharacterized DUF497 family protein
MRDGFEWDRDKATRNWRTHGISFEQAIVAMSDAFSIEWIDDREDHGEERFNLLGMCASVLLRVTYTERGATLLIISARRADRNEINHYFRENATR